MKAIQIEAYGNATEVLRVADLPDVGAPAAGEVVIEVEASPINQYDLLLIAGGYGYRPRLPAVMGGATNWGSGQGFPQARSKWHRGRNDGKGVVRFLAVFYGGKDVRL